MDILIPPTFKFLHLLPLLVYFMLLFHLPYMGMVLVSSGMSAAYRKFKPKLADDLMDLIISKIGPYLIFGFLPTVSLAILLKMRYFTSGIPVDKYLLELLGLQVGAVLVLAFYRRTRNLLAGAGGALLTLVYCFHFINVLSFLIFPEKWPFHQGVLPFPLFAITPLVQFGLFLMLSLIMTGAAILFFFYKWTEKKLPEDRPHYDFLKYNGFGLLLAGSLAVPPLILWDLITLPPFALSGTVFVLCGLTMVVLFILASSASAMIRRRAENRPPYMVTAFVMAIIAFGLVIGKDHVLQANANLETIAAAHIDAKKILDKEMGEREEIYAKIGGIDPKKGEEVFNTICTTCHSFTEKKVGPPLNVVLKKYAGKEAELIEFIKNPKKVDPNYTAMPRPAISPIKVKSVVKYLLGREESKK